MRILIITLLLLLNIDVYSQELRATVQVNVESLKTQAKEKLRNFAQEVETYLNTNSFSDYDYSEYPIECNFNIFFTSASGEKSYGAQVVVTSTRPLEEIEGSTMMMRVQDSPWSFQYESGQSWIFNQADFDPLTSFLDFYAYLIIGLDLDSFFERGGTPMFEKAYDIANWGAASYREWKLEANSYNKMYLVKNLLDAAFEQFRIDFYNYHWNGLDLYESDRERGVNNMAMLVKNLAKVKDKLDPRNILLRVFFDAKNRELANYMKEYKDRNEIYQLLITVDAGHITKYDEIVE
ncbi:MAG: DUF4835 family protein [Bacteroidetes bacterium]|nr:DUF4835 family protein [Bacteroidota bacterium]